MSAPGWRSAWAWALPLGCLATFLLLLHGTGNRSAFLWLNGLSSATGDLPWALLTVCGDTVVVAALALPLLAPRPRLLVAYAPAALACAGWIHLLKPLVDSDRPLGVLPAAAVHVIGPGYHFHSFPSGHAATAFLLAGVLAQGLRRPLPGVLAVALAAGVAVSRSVVGVHWPLDTLAGAFGGWLAATAGLAVEPCLGARLHAALQRLVPLALAGCALALVLGFDTRYPQAATFTRLAGLLCLLLGARPALRCLRGAAGPGQAGVTLGGRPRGADAGRQGPPP